MNELDYQRMVVKAVQSKGGFAFKLSNRFLIGIPDLLILLPTATRTGLWEVKCANKPKTLPSVKLDLTPLQARTLNDYRHAGGLAGVISILKGSELSMGASLLDNLQVINRGKENEYRMRVDYHQPLRRGQREDDIVNILWSV